MITKKEIQQLSDDDLTDLLSRTLMHVLYRQGSEVRGIPEGIELTVHTDNLKIKFDIRIKEELTAAGKKDFDEFCNSKRIDEAAKLFYGGTLFKPVIHPEDLDES